MRGETKAIATMLRYRYLEIATEYCEDQDLAKQVEQLKKLIHDAICLIEENA